VTEDVMNTWTATLHSPICAKLLGFMATAASKQRSATIVKSLLELGLRYQDLEWFTRAAIVRAVLKVHLQASGKNLQTAQKILPELNLSMR